MNGPCLSKDEGWRELITEVATAKDVEGIGDVVVLEEARPVQREGGNKEDIHCSKSMVTHMHGFVAVYQTAYTGHYLTSKRAVIWIFTSVEELRLKFGPGCVRGAV